MFNIITTQKGWIYMSMEKNNNIVIVEDDVLSRITLKKMINNQQVCADFDNAQDCFDYIKLHNNVDLIIMDATLPYLNGIQASKIIKKYNPSSDTLNIMGFPINWMSILRIKVY